MFFKLKKIPLNTRVGIPFIKLSYFAAHKYKLFTWMSVHICNKCSYACKLAVIVTRHFADKRAFAVSDFIVRNRKNESL